MDNDKTEQKLINLRNKIEKQKLIIELKAVRDKNKSWIVRLVQSYCRAVRDWGNWVVSNNIKLNNSVRGYKIIKMDNGQTYLDLSQGVTSSEKREEKPINSPNFLEMDLSMFELNFDRY